MTEVKVGISVLDLFKQIVAKLVLDLGGKKIHFPARIMAEIANDSDWHRNRVGYIGYDEAFLVKVQDKLLVLAMGEKCGQYPGDQFCCDLVIAPVLTTSKKAKEINSAVCEILSDNTYFCCSTLIGMASGSLGMNQKGLYTQQITDALGNNIEEYIARNMEIDHELMTMDLRPLVKATVLYKEELVNHLANILKKVVMA